MHGPRTVRDRSLLGVPVRFQVIAAAHPAARCGFLLKEYVFAVNGVSVVRMRRAALVHMTSRTIEPPFSGSGFALYGDMCRRGDMFRGGLQLSSELCQRCKNPGASVRRSAAGA